ncbi:hypothetical protein Lmor_2280 [Legionella moravica]|uniref:HEPN AbiU2-like domain-containing protein n=1 Tax=Legionella moravica TaxID=39962 RepID=A0A378JWP7_9GAMM|nr:hypothetical protein [Legionella moravica]KTD32342.1 hypothetical protein Lmor_2280 [Legionella moravica]STX62437.1 Uncharacterised protein [Legionella moravica]
MDKIKKYRRVALLCCHFSRNYAYYKAGWEKINDSKFNNKFWITVQNNFLDIAVMEWMKLFGSYSEHHHWKNILSDIEKFKIDMLKYCGLNEDEFDRLHNEIKKYRDEFVAHLDSKETMKIPIMTKAFKATKFYYRHIYEQLPKESSIGLPSNLQEHYNLSYSDAEKYYNVQ